MKPTHRTAEVHPAELSEYQQQQTGLPRHCYCVYWQTPIMPCLAFWYFPTEQEAREAAEQILKTRG